MVDFTDILSKKADSVEKPKPKPVGTYLTTIQGMPAMRTVTSKAGEDMPVVDFKLKVLMAQDDVDQDDIKDDISSWAPFIHSIFLHTEGGQYAFKQFLTVTLDIEGGKKTLGEMLAEAPGKQVLMKLKHEPYVTREGTTEIGTRIESCAKP